MLRTPRNGKLILTHLLNGEAKALNLIYFVSLPVVPIFDRSLQISVYKDTGENLLICSVCLTKLVPILTVIYVPSELRAVSH
jgi:hypothetical protein